MEDVIEIIRGLDLSGLRVIHYPDPRLAAPNVDLPRVDPCLAPLVGRMFELMFESRGVGLAAPQVGLNVRLFVASPSFSPDDLRVYINPRLIALEGSQESEEGCLSLPGYVGEIKRAEKVTAKGKNLEGKEIRIKAEGLLAQALEHEIDHVNGILYIDHLESPDKLHKLTPEDMLEEAEGEEEL